MITFSYYLDGFPKTCREPGDDIPVVIDRLKSVESFGGYISIEEALMPEWADYKKVYIPAETFELQHVSGIIQTFSVSKKDGRLVGKLKYDKVYVVTTTYEREGYTIRPLVEKKD